MDFIKHSELKDMHAFLGASKCSWLNYNDDKLVETFINNEAKELGTRLHQFASDAINLGIKLPATQKTLNMFVNDAIRYRMNSEQVLFYSYNCFGTADAISFKNNKLRIHDLKTGKTPVHIEQLEIYAALFCLEYSVDPLKIEIELRIYQNDECVIHEPEPQRIMDIMQKIIKFDKLINSIKRR